MNNKGQIMREHLKERLGNLEKAEHFLLDPPLPGSLNIEVNNTCNQRCVFCPFHGMYAPRKMTPAVLDIDFVKALIGQAHKLGIGKKEIGFYMAGEAFLYKGLVELIAYAKELGFKYVFLTTNGALATPDKMKAVIDAGIDSIRISVNASEREMYKEIHGRDDFETVVNNIKYMHEYIGQNNLEIATSISCVLTKRTLGIEENMREIFGAYVDDIMFAPVMVSRLDNYEEVREKYGVLDEEAAEIIPEFVCPVLFETMYINALGQAVPCCIAYDKDVYFADLKKNPSLEDAWKSEGYKRYRRIFIEKESGKGTICENCELRKFTINACIYDDK